MHVSRFAGKNAPSETAVSKQDASISFQCAPANAQRLVQLALSELTDLQVHDCPLCPLFGEHAGTMIQFMWQADLHGVAKYVTDCLGVYYDADPDRGRASDQP